MAKKRRLAEAKATFSAIVEDVVNSAEPYVIERRGRPVVAIVRFDRLDCVEAEGARGGGGGALALAGLWGEVGDPDLDEFVAEVYAARDADTGRAVDLEA